MLKSLTDLKEYTPALAIGAGLILLAFFVPRWFMHGGAPPPQFIVVPEKFQHDCIDSVLAGGVALPSCAGFDAMKIAYGIDVRVLLVQEQGRMIMTARKISRGDVTDEKEYSQCLESGECVKVPGLNFEIDRDSPEGKAARAEFRHLVDNGSITQGNCDRMDICRALVKSGIIPQPPPLDTGS